MSGKVSLPGAGLPPMKTVVLPFYDHILGDRHKHIDRQPRMLAAANQYVGNRRAGDRPSHVRVWVASGMYAICYPGLPTAFLLFIFTIDPVNFSNTLRGQFCHGPWYAYIGIAFADNDNR